MNQEQNAHEANRKRRDALLARILTRKHDDVWQAGVAEDSGAMWFSKVFLKKWVTRATHEASNEKFTQQTSEDINMAITCAHGKLGVEEKKQRDIVPKVRQTFSRRNWRLFCCVALFSPVCLLCCVCRCFCPFPLFQPVWDEFVYFYPKSRAYSADDAEECPQCLTVMSKLEDSVRAWGQRHKVDKEQLSTVHRLTNLEFPLVGRAPKPGTYFIVPGEWARSMKDHLAAKIEVVPKPLRNDALLCKHGRLLFNPLPNKLDHWMDQPEPYNVPGAQPHELATMERPAWEQLKDNSFYVLDDDQAPPIRLRVGKSQ
jgi:hypothetical protein